MPNTTGQVTNMLYLASAFNSNIPGNCNQLCQLGHLLDLVLLELILLKLTTLVKFVSANTQV